MGEYLLRHRDCDAALLLIDDLGNILKMKELDKQHLPYMGACDLPGMRRWFKERAISNKRKDLSEMLKKYNSENPEIFLLRSMALSLMDNYWVVPLSNCHLSFDEVNLYDNAEDSVVFVSSDGTVFQNNAHASLNGNQIKACQKVDGEWHLWKKKETVDGQQAVNEAFIAHIHKMQNKFPHVCYEIIMENNKPMYSDCCLFTNKSLELISAHELTGLRKKTNDVSEYENYISLCAEYGLDYQYVHDFMDYQTMVDFLTLNTDRHFNNFGVLRNPETLELVSVAPIFDNGNSMTFRDISRYGRRDILELEISSFTPKLEGLLKNIKNHSIVDFGLLPSAHEVRDFYASHGIDEARADTISQNYNKCKELLYEFHKGIKISTYFEDRIEKFPEYDAQCRLADQELHAKELIPK